MEEFTPSELTSNIDLAVNFLETKGDLILWPFSEIEKGLLISRAATDKFYAYVINSSLPRLLGSSTKEEIPYFKQNFEESHIRTNMPVKSSFLIKPSKYIYIGELEKNIDKIVNEKVVPYSNEYDFLFTFKRQDFILGKNYHIKNKVLIDKIYETYLNSGLQKKMKTI